MSLSEYGIESIRPDDLGILSKSNGLIFPSNF